MHKTDDDISTAQNQRCLSVRGSHLQKHAKYANAKALLSTHYCVSEKHKSNAGDESRQAKPVLDNAALALLEHEW